MAKSLFMAGHEVASKHWEYPRVKELNELKNRMRGRQASRDDAATFDLLTERWRTHWLDPRLVESWTYEADAAGLARLLCTMVLPDGVKAEIPPPIEKRIGIAKDFALGWTVRYSARCPPNSDGEWFANGSPCGANEQAQLRRAFFVCPSPGRRSAEHASRALLGESGECSCSDVDDCLVEASSGSLIATPFRSRNTSAASKPVRLLPSTTGWFCGMWNA
jgi:hypothetical protein